MRRPASGCATTRCTARPSTGTWGSTVVVAATARGKRPLLVFLHGRGGDEARRQRRVPARRCGARLARAGRGVPGRRRPQATGTTAPAATGAATSCDEVIPQVGRAASAPIRRRVAIGGISMGGFGAFDIARCTRGALLRGRRPLAGALADGGETAPGAFDDAADFARHDVDRVAARAAARRRGLPAVARRGRPPTRSAPATTHSPPTYARPVRTPASTTGPGATTATTGTRTGATTCAPTPAR